MNKFITYLKKYKLFVIIVLVISILSSDFFMFTLVNKIDRATGGKLHLGYIRNHIVKGFESLNPFVGKFALDEYKLPTFEIEINQKGVNKLTKMLKASETTLDYRGLAYSSSKNKVWIKSKVLFDNQKYKAKITFHGSDSINFRNDKKSIAIKISKKKLFNHMRRFSFVILEEASIPTIFSYKLQEWLNGFKVNSYLVKVKINGISQGVFLLEEKLQKSLLEKNNLAGVDIIKPVDEWDGQYQATHEIPFNWNLANTEIRRISKKNVGQLLVFEKLYKCKTYKCMKNYIDEKKVINEEALRVLFGSFHAIVGDNQKLLYNTSNARIWIYFRTEDELNKIPYFFDKTIYGANQKYKNNFIYYLGLSEEFRAKRDKILWYFVQNKDKIIKMYDDIYNKNIGSILADSNHYTNGRFINYTIKQKKANLISNLNTLKKYLNYGKVYSYVKFLTPKKMELVISADSNAPLMIDNIKFKYSGNNKIKITSLDNNQTVNTTFDKLNDYFKDKIFMIGLDKNYKPIEHRHHFIISFESNVTGFNVSYKNRITNQKIHKYYNFYKFIKYTPFIKSSGDLVLDGNYEFNKTMVVNNLIIKAGTHISMLPKISILANNLQILGQKDKKIVIINKIKDKPFGVIAVRGDKTQNININYLDLSGGKDAILNGSYFSGGLSLYDVKSVKIQNSIIHNNSADDGMNIKNANVLLKNNIFAGNKADQVDFDFCVGKVIHNKFLKYYNDTNVIIPIDDNGDGLDLSGSKILIENNIFKGFLDKGNSIGEHTLAFMYHNRYINNRSAITSKDASKVYIKDNFYKNNKIDIEMYQKKQIFAFPNVFNLNPNKKLNIKNKHSNYYIIEGNNSLENITSMKVFDELKSKKWIKK